MLLRPTADLQPAVQAVLVKGTVWGANSVVPPALADKDLSTAIGVKSPTAFGWTLDDVPGFGEEILHGS